MLLDCPDPLIDSDPPSMKLPLVSMFRESAPLADGDTRPVFHPPSLAFSSASGDNSRDEVGVWCKRIYKDLSETWPQLRFTVKFTLQDELIVSFILDNDVNISRFALPLLKYMNNMARIGLAAEFKLKRRGDRWNVIENEQLSEEVSVRALLIYALYAPWVNTSQRAVHKAAAVTERNLARTKTMKFRTDQQIVNAKNNNK